MQNFRNAAGNLFMGEAGNDFLAINDSTIGIMVKVQAPQFPLMMTQKGDLLYVACRTAKYLGVYNMKTFSSTTLVDLASPADGVFLTAQYICVTFSGAPSPAFSGVKRYNINTYAYVDTIFAGENNWGYITTATKLYVGNPTLKTIRVFNLADLSLITTYSCPETGAPYGIAVDEANNRIWYTHTTTTYGLYERKLSDFTLNRSNTTTLSKEMYQILYYPEQNWLLIAGATMGKVFSYRLDTWAVHKTVTGTAGGGLAYPSGIALDLTRRRVWVCGNNLVKPFDLHLLE
jgi:DNA-binding beta-propeller fold protein YncE